MKKTSISFGVLIVLVVLSGYFIWGDFNLQVNAHDTYDVMQGETDGDVIQAETKIINLSRLEQFYKQVKRNNDDHITVAIPQSSQKYELYELHVSNGKLKLYYDIIEDGQGRKEYKVKVYDSMKKIYKQDQVTYILINGKEERSFLSYNLK